MSRSACARLTARCLPLALAALAATGCTRQGELYDDRDWTKGPEESGTAWREVESLFSAEESDADRFSHAPLGVRHDLTMANEATLDARCSCLDVAVGRPDDDRFRWRSRPPAIAPDQVAFAMRSEGSACAVPETGQQRRPSIYAVDQQGPHVIVVVEELPLDRPQALGALIPMPRPGGSLFVRSRKYKDRVLPYAQGERITSGMCKVLTRDRVQPRR